MTKVKICGLRREEDISIVNRLLPDCVGFVLAPSPRRVTPAAAAGLKARLDGRILAAGVFVNASMEEVLEAARLIGLDIIQLHGSESGAYIKKLKSRTDREIWKAVRVGGPGTLPAPSGAHRVLYDTFDPKTAGGTGRTFDHGLLKGIPLGEAILAGGITPGNARAAARLQPYMIDVSSGAETVGVKDERKIFEIIEGIRGV